MPSTFSVMHIIIHLCRFAILPALVLCLMLPSGCRSVPLGKKTLKVGINPDYPPLAMKAPADTSGRRDRIAGLEVELAMKVSQRLERELELVELQWDELVPALLQGEIDVIMSGMTITRKRQIQVAFTDPYLETGLAALYRANEAERYDEQQELLDTPARVGVKSGTVADIFVTRDLGNAQIIRYNSAIDAAIDLTRNRVDLYIDDSPAAAWLAAKHDAKLGARLIPNTERLMAWAVRRDRVDLLKDLNDAIREWKKDGTIRREAEFWMPPIRVE